MPGELSPMRLHLCNHWAKPEALRGFADVQRLSLSRTDQKSELRHTPTREERV